MKIVLSTKSSLTAKLVPHYDCCLPYLPNKSLLSRSLGTSLNGFPCGHSVTSDNSPTTWVGILQLVDTYKSI